MFTNEFFFDSSVTTVLDDSGAYKDIELIVTDECVYLRQHSCDDWSEIISLSHQQWLELIRAFSLPEGAYHCRIGKSHDTL